MPPRSTRYCRPKSDPPEALLEHLVRRYNYGTREEWQDHLAQGNVWVERGHVPPNQRRRSAAAVTLSPSTSASIAQGITTNSAPQPAGSSSSLDAQPPRSPTIAVFRNGDVVLLQGDVIVFDPPKSLEPEVDTNHITILYMDANIVCCVKNGAIPVAEGGRYANNTLAAVLAERHAYSDYGDDDDATAAVEESLTPAATGSSALTKSSSPNKKRSRPPVCIGTLFPVHRLDRETSGIVVLARHKASAAFLASQFHHIESDDGISTAPAASVVTELDSSTDSQNAGVPASKCNRKEAVKVYQAIVEGIISREWLAAQQANSKFVTVRESNSSGAQQQPPLQYVVTITAPLGPTLASPTEVPPEQAKLAKLRMRCYTDVPNATSVAGEEIKSAKTELVVLATNECLGLTFVRCRIFTGRTHQIRLHCAHLGFPILGDKMYTTRTPGVIGGSHAVDDDCYWRRVRGQEAMQWSPGEWRMVSSGPSSLLCPSSLPSSTLVVKRHMLHAFQLTCTIPPSKGAAAAAAAPTDSGALSSMCRDSDGGKEEERKVFEVPALEWFLRDLAPIKEEESEERERSRVGGDEWALVELRRLLTTKQFVLS
ncbi:RNA pseudouridylate synthase, putative [Bodo saltans]|uniref:RNA pseudouridylate synthase, putative n=1 Tax=Bodo saltans TaxID=75058 RepID=A0A0S4JCR9_BODSA|nr:RNA pseudouridylate synthase, putative [Bodo saltans]|eukprot:CUG87305.1 RNA pseudouridylate synthase, putative [Bodo saltans]